MINAQKPNTVGLSQVIARIRSGRYVIPDFQREFKWDPSKIRELMRSIFLDYYIGTLLLWKGKLDDFDTFSCRPIKGFSGVANPEHIVLDGQQRLSAMHYAFMAPDELAPSRKSRYLYFIRVDSFEDENYDLAFEYYWTQYGRNLLNDSAEQYKTHQFPLAVLGQPPGALASWIADYKAHWQSEQARLDETGDVTAANEARRHGQKAASFGDRLWMIRDEYQVSYIELDRDLDVDKVCDIFSKINSTGQALDVFDLLNALLVPKRVALRQTLWENAKPRLAWPEAPRMNIYVLQVMSMLAQDGVCSPKYLYYLVPGRERKLQNPDGSSEHRTYVRNEGDFERQWEASVAAIEKALRSLRTSYGVISPRLLPYPSMIPVFASLQVEASRLPGPSRLDAQRKIASWYWTSVFRSRYSSAVESTAAADYRDLCRWFADAGDEPHVLDDIRAAAPTLDLRGETSNSSAVYRGVMNLAILRGAEDWIDRSAPTQDDLDDHHIVPKSRRKELQIDNAIDSVLNRTPLSSATNRTVIRDRLPNEYLPELIEANDKETVQDVFETHLISAQALDILLRDPFRRGDFEEFLYERQATVRRELESVLAGHTSGPSPAAIQAADRNLGQIELSLRKLIDSTCRGDFSVVPTNILGNVKNRIKSSMNANPSLDRGRDWTLRETLDFFDLRELEMTITSKPSWPLFQSLFRSKKDVTDRFRQLAELRNCIRHSRPVGEVTLKDGEAAIHWFRQVVTEYPSE